MESLASSLNSFINLYGENSAVSSPSMYISIILPSIHVFPLFRSYINLFLPFPSSFPFFLFLSTYIGQKAAYSEQLIVQLLHACLLEI